MAQDEARDPGPDQLADEPVDGRWHRPPPRERGQTLRPRIEPDREPVTGDRQARAQVVRPVGDGRRQDHARRPGGECEPDRIVQFDPAGELERDRDPGRDRADRLEIGRRPGPRAVEVDEVDQPRAHGHEPLGDAIGPVGRRADPGACAGPVDEPRAAGLQVDRGDHLHGRDQAPVVRSRRWKLIGSEPLRSSASWKPFRLNRSPSRRSSSSRRVRSRVRPSRYDSG